MVEVGGFAVEDGALLFLDKDKTPKALDKVSEEADKVSKETFLPLKRQEREGGKEKGNKGKKKGGRGSHWLPPPWLPSRRFGDF